MGAKGNIMKRVLIEAPILTQSGYGEHSRFVYRALRERQDLDLYLVPLANHRGPDAPDASAVSTHCC